MPQSLLQEPLLDALPSHVAVLDTGGTIVKVNQAWRNFASNNGLGSPDHALGLNYLHVCERAQGKHSAQASEARTGIERVLRGNSPEFVLDYPCHSPVEDRWFRLVSTPIERGCIVAHTNITDLKECQNKLLSAVTIGRLGTWRFDILNDRLEWDGVTHQILGTRHKSFRGSLDQFLAFVHPRDRQSVESSRRGASRRRTIDLEYRVSRRDGTQRTVHERGEVTYRGGRPTHANGVMLDVTPERDREASLLAAKNRAEELSRLKSSFLANTSHDIRTAMNGITGLAGLALGTALDSEQREYLEGVETCSTLVLSIMNQILDFSKIESGSVRLDISTFNLHSILRDIVRAFQPAATQKSLHLALELSRGVPEMVSGDCTRLRQIIVNLVSNAIKFTDTGRVDIKVECLDSQAMVRFSVRDTGIGIAPANHVSVFEPFKQAEPGAARQHGGTGLGLSISARLANLLGARIALQSREGEGSYFYFDLKLASVPTAL